MTKEMVVMVDSGKKNKFEVAKPTLVLYPLFRCSSFGSCKGGSFEVYVLTFVKKVFGERSIIREGN